ncbi:MAG: hypothetical protein JJLCMIEE_03101 [Acidimicrobiales bacterium]|nr:hypothetical protein [Acidimicrobiales bacterium]
MRKLQISFLCLGAVALALTIWNVARPDQLHNWWIDVADVPFLAVGALATVAVAATVRLSRGLAKVAWALVLIASLLSTAADVGWVVLKARGETPYVSPADFLYMLVYPFLFAALFVIAHGRDIKLHRGGLAEGLAVAASVALLAWQVAVVSPGVLSEAGGTLQQLVIVAYPALDVLLLAAVVGLLVSPGRRTVALWGLFAYAFLFLASDIAYAAMANASTDTMQWTDVGFLLAYLALGVAVLDPSAKRIADPQTGDGDGRVRYVLIGAAIVAPSITVAVLVTVLGDFNAVVLVGATVVIATVVSVRIARMMASEQQARARAEAATDLLARSALTDVVTGLPNRNALVEEIPTVLCDLDHRGALLFIDLDRFKLVNDTAGHQAGDDVLRESAARVESCVRAGDRVFRLAGDEFVVLCSGMSRGDEAESVATRISDALRDPFTVGESSIFVGASIGIAFTHRDEDLDPERILSDADLAMYAAKRDGRHAVRVFEPAMRADAEGRRRIEVALRCSLENDEIIPAFQPVVDLSDESVVGFEALARWPEKHDVVHEAAEFIEVAEMTGLVGEIDRRVMQQACQRVGAWNDHRLDRAPLWVSVNVSLGSLAFGDFPDQVRSILDSTSISPEWLMIELTESSLAIDADQAVEMLTAVHDLGVRIAVDDFGTGFSSLASVLRYPVDTIKIDRMFVHDLSRATYKRSLAAATLRVAETIGIVAVAEGVETPDQATALKDLGCHLAQGHLFARPMSAHEAARLAEGTDTTHLAHP